MQLKLGLGLEVRVRVRVRRLEEFLFHLFFSCVGDFGCGLSVGQRIKSDPSLECSRSAAGVTPFYGAEYDTSCELHEGLGWGGDVSESLGSIKTEKKRRLMIIIDDNE